MKAETLQNVIIYKINYTNDNVHQCNFKPTVTRSVQAIDLMAIEERYREFTSEIMVAIYH